MYFISSTKPGYDMIIQKAYDAALAYAREIEATGKITMAVERLRPVHLGISAGNTIPYNSGNARNFTMLTNCGIFIAGIYSNSTNIKEITLYNGTNYLGIWSVRDIVGMQEREGAYAGNLDRVKFRSNEVLKTQIVATTGQSGTADEDVFFIGFAVMPESLVNTKIVNEAAA